MWPGVPKGKVMTMYTERVHNTIVFVFDYILSMALTIKCVQHKRSTYIKGTLWDVTFSIMSILKI